MAKKKEIPLPRIYEIIGEDCMEKLGRKLAKKVPKGIIEEMCEDNVLAMSFDSLIEESDLFCIFISKSQTLIICQITPDIVDEENNVIKTGEKQTLMTMCGGKDITRLYKNPIWNQSIWITEDHISETQQCLKKPENIWRKRIRFCYQQLTKFIEKFPRGMPKKKGLYESLQVKEAFHFMRGFLIWNLLTNYYHRHAFRFRI